MIENSIIIPVRNQKNSLFLLLNSLKKQIKKPRIFEIVICDDGSDDGTEKAVKKLRYPVFFKYFRNDPPLGRSLNRNRGFEKSTGKNLIFLDGDMVPDDKYIEAMLGDNNADIIKLGMPRPPPNEKPDRLVKYLYSRGRYSSNFTNKVLPGRFFTSNSFYISRSNFGKLNGFDTNFKGWGGEDIDFGLRLESHGIPITNASDAVTFHYHKRTIKSLVKDHYSFGQSSFDYLIKKHPAFIKQIPAHLLGLPDSFSKSNFLYRFISHFTISRITLALAEKIVSGSINKNLPDYMFDFIIWGNLALGYRNRMKNKEQPA